MKFAFALFLAIGVASTAGAQQAPADVREFGLTWEDCEGYLSRLGYRTKVDVVQAR